MKIVGFISGPAIARGDFAKVKLKQLTHLIWIGLQARSASDPTIETFDNYSPWNEITMVVNAGHAKGVKVLASLYDETKLNILVANATLRAQLVTNLKNIVTQYNLDGIEIDWEGAYQVAQVNTFVQALYTTLHPLGKTVSLCADFDATNITSAYAQYVDWIDVMTYDMWHPHPYPYHSLYEDMVTYMNFWVDSGFPKEKLLVGIPFFGREADNPESALWAHYSDIVDVLNPTSDQNQANVSTFQGATVHGGVLWWNGIDLVRQKVGYVIASGFGGVMVYELGTDKLQDPRSLLQVIYQEVTNVNVFPPGTAKTAKVTINVTPSGLNCEAEVFLGPNETTKVATSGKIKFVSTAADQVVNLPITMPTAPATYKVFVDLYAEGFLIGRYVDVNTVIIPSSTVGPIVWG